MKFYNFIVFFTICTVLSHYLTECNGFWLRRRFESRAEAEGIFIIPILKYKYLAVLTAFTFFQLFKKKTF